MNSPEPRLTPPEDVIIAHCPVCGYEIYDGEVCWAFDGNLLCEEHLSDLTAKFFGCRKIDGREQ